MSSYGDSSCYCRIKNDWFQVLKIVKRVKHSYLLQYLYFKLYHQTPDVYVKRMTRIKLVVYIMWKILTITNTRTIIMCHLKQCKTGLLQRASVLTIRWWEVHLSLINTWRCDIYTSWTNEKRKPLKSFTIVPKGSIAALLIRERSTTF